MVWLEHAFKKKGIYVRFLTCSCACVCDPFATHELIMTTAGCQRLFDHDGTASQRKLVEFLYPHVFLLEVFLQRCVGSASISFCFLFRQVVGHSLITQIVPVLCSYWSNHVPNTWHLNIKSPISFQLNLESFVSINVANNYYWHVSSGTTLQLNENNNTTTLILLR